MDSAFGRLLSCAFLFRRMRIELKFAVQDLIHELAGRWRKPRCIGPDGTMDT